MATLKDIKSILEKIAAQGARAGGDDGRGRPADAMTQQESVNAAERRVELAQQEYDAYNNMFFIRNSIFENEEKSKLLREAELDLQKAEIDLLEKKSKHTANYSAHMAAHYKQQAAQRKKDADNDAKAKKAEDRKKNAQKDAYAKGKKFAGQYTQIIAKSASLGMNQSAIGKSISKGAGGLMKMVGSMASLVGSAVSFGAALVSAGIALSTVLVVLGAIMLLLLPLAIGGALIGGLVALASWVVSAAVEARDTAAAFTMLTGASMDYGKEIIELKGELAELNIGAKELTASYGALYKQTTIFTQATTTQRMNMGATVAMLEKWGVSAQSTAKMMQVAVTSLGVSVEVVGDEMAALKGHAQLLQVDIAAYMQDFAAMGSELAVYDDAIGTFKDLAAAQKVTGMEMRKIIDLARKFDTFEDAAKMTGRLNAALGGNFVNAMDMMTETDPVGRFKMLRQALKDGGVEFKNMGYYAKRFYVEQLGLKDVTELAVLMRGDLNDLTGDYGKSADELMALKKQTQQYQSTLDIFKGFLAKMSPVLTNLVDPIQKWIETLTDKDGGATQAFTDLQTSITEIVEQGMIPFMKMLPAITKDFLTFFTHTSAWLKNNKELISQLASIVEFALKLTVALGVFGINVADYVTDSPLHMSTDPLNVIKGSAIAGAKTYKQLTGWGEAAKASESLAKKTSVAGKNVKQYSTELDAATKSTAKFTKEANTQRSLSFNQSLEFYNNQFSQMPKNISKAAESLSTMRRPILAATADMNKLAAANSKAIEFAPMDVLNAEKSSQMIGLLANQAVAWATTSKTSGGNSSATTQSSAPLEKQPIEITLRTEDGVLAKQVINVIGREIQAVVS